MLFFDFVEEYGERGVEFAGQRSSRRLFVDEAGCQCFVGLGKSLKGRQNIRVRGCGLRGTEFGDRKCERGHELLMGVDDVLWDFFVEERSIPKDAALVIVFVAVSREEVGAVGRAVYGDFALGAATDGADLLRFGGTEARGFAFFTNRTGHGGSRKRPGKSAEYRVRR